MLVLFIINMYLIYICIYKVRLNVIINILIHMNDFISWVFIYVYVHTYKVISI